MSSFVEQLPDLLRQLSSPVTQFTSSELWSRIQAEGWECCVPVLLSSLQGDDPDVKRLVLSILSEESDQFGSESTEPFHEVIERLLADEDRLVRIAAVHAVGEHQIKSPTTLAALRRIAYQDELPLARQALVTLIEADDGAVEELRQMFRGVQTD